MGDYLQQGDPTNFAEEAKIIYWKRKKSGLEQLESSIKAQQEREKEIEHFTN